MAKCGEDLGRDIMRNMKKIGILPERYHTEYGPGQYEISQSPVYGVQAADNAFRTKQVVKEIARNHGHKAMWLTKTYPNASGSSGERFFIKTTPLQTEIDWNWSILIINE